MNERRHENERAAAAGIGPGVPRWAIHTALGFVVLTLVALVVVPAVGGRRVAAGRAELAAVGEPARRLVRDVQAAHAREMSALRGFVITEMDAFLQSYESARAAEVDAYERLGPLAQRLGPAVHESYTELVTAADRWHSSVDEAGVIERREAPPDYIERIPFEEAIYSEVLEASVGLDQAIVEEVQLRERRLLAAEDRQRAITFVLIVLGLAAVLVVAWFAHRLLLLATSLNRRAREEAAFRHSAETLSAALGSAEAMNRLARSSLEAIGATGAFVERLQSDANEIEIVAAAGTGTPKIRTRVAFPDSLTQLLVERNEPVLTSEVAVIGPLISPYLGRACDRCWVLASLLVTEEDEALGTLVMLRPSDWGSFQEEEDRPRARVLANLASLALRRGVAMEESERRREEVERLMRSKAQLMRGLSHDLKNPIGNVDGYAHLLEAETKGALSTDQREYVSGIRRSVRSALSIIEDVLELSRAEAGQLRIERAPVVLDEVVRQLVEDQRPAAKTAGIQLRANLPDRLPEIETDPVRVRQILENLVSNAIKYTPEGGQVLVSALRRDEDAPRPGTWVAIDVVDTGPGIPPEDRDRIFDEFYRLGTPEDGGGTGLGLAIAQRIARLLGGEITLNSQIGEGSTFTLWLPITGVEVRSRAA